MSRSLATLETFLNGFLAAQPWLLDPVLAPLPWRRELAAKPNRPLKIGYYLDDGAVRVQPPHELAVSKVILALKLVGHEGTYLTKLNVNGMH